jgi:hypothetical protein
MRSTSLKTPRTWKRRVAYGVLSVVLLWLCLGVLPGLLGGDKAAQFGDAFGGVNALFSGLAFLGVIAAIVLQRDELAMQRTELELQRRELELNRAEMTASREELAGQRLQLESQDRTARQHGFESTFFQLLRFHHELAAQIADETKPTIQGRQCFRLWENILRERLSRAPEPHKVASEIFNDVFSNRGDSAHVYLRNLYQLAKLVAQQAPSNPETYASLLRAQLSGSELTLVAFYSVAPDGERVKALVQRFALLERMPQPGVFRDLLGPPAFGIAKAPDSHLD